MILAVDIGGTKVSAACFDKQVMDKVSRYLTADYTGLDVILRRCLEDSGAKDAPLAGVGIGVAGPVLGRTVKLTNLPWSIDADALQAKISAPVYLLNDLEAHGYATVTTKPKYLVTLQAGVQRPGNQALIAAGTGLGEAILVRHHESLHVCASEGGHATFGPVSTDDLELARFLQGRYAHVSWERVVSGLDGFRNIYDFLTSTGRIRVTPALAATVDGQQDIGAAIVKGAATGDAGARQVMAWFVRLYGAEAGNLCLKAMALGGMFIGGGIAQHILPWLQDGTFTEAFAAKGRFAAMLRDVPIHIMTDPDAALKGAANFVAMRSGETP